MIIVQVTIVGNDGEVKRQDITVLDGEYKADYERQFDDVKERTVKYLYPDYST